MMKLFLILTRKLGKFYFQELKIIAKMKTTSVWTIFMQFAVALDVAVEFIEFVESGTRLIFEFGMSDEFVILRGFC